ncbi:MAG: hypothetical protein LBU05_06925, partial [Bifidobacteriaceae bacterium]|nr:hypothetical protein [Bifidobacteriaceae bacterium]
MEWKGARARIGGVLTAAAVLALALTGCMRMRFDFTVNANDTISTEVIVAYEDAVLAEAAAAGGMTVDQLLKESGVEDQIATAFQSGDEVDVAGYTQDGFTGWVIRTVEPQSLYDLDSPSAAAAMGSLDLRHEGDQFLLTGVIDLTGPQFAIPPSLTEDPATAEDLAGLDLQFIFTFPGPVTSANGVIDGNTVTFEPKMGAAVEIEAVASATPGAAAASPHDSAASAFPTPPAGPKGPAAGPVASSLPGWAIAAIGAGVA